MWGTQVTVEVCDAIDASALVDSCLRLIRRTSLLLDSRDGDGVGGAVGADDLQVAAVESVGPQVCVVGVVDDEFAERTSLRGVVA